MKTIFNGTRHGNCLYLYGFKKAGIKKKDIPPKFEIEIDTDKIKARSSYKYTKAKNGGKE